MLRRPIVSRILGAALVLAATAPLQAQSGHSTWGPWSFDWEVAGNRGLGIRNVAFNGTQYIYKANLPVIRVKYVNDNWLTGCGPYQDRISWNKLEPTTCSSSNICQRSFTAGGANWLELGAYAEIGKYQIYQAWYFGDNGQIDARVFSRGWACEMTHAHHAYWRLDIDADGSSTNQILMLQDSGGSSIYATEQNDTKFPPGNKRWLVRGRPTGRGLWIFPGAGDGTADGFSTKDVGVRRYQDPEDENWPFGAWGSLGYNNGESVNNQDIVFWYVAHMPHVYTEGVEDLGNAEPWHAVGPTLMVELPPVRGRTLVNANSSKCLDVAGGSAADQANVQQFGCHNGSNQLWRFTALGELVNISSGKCLDVAGASTADRANVQQYTCHGGRNQRWRRTTQGTIVNEHSGKCLDVAGASTADQANVQQYTCNGGTNQRWQFR